MPGTEELYCWDSCIFLAWLKDEVRPLQDEMDGVRAFIEKLERNQVTLIASTLVFTEVSHADVPPATMRMFDDVMKRPNIRRVSVDVKVAKFARDLRDYYTQRPAEYNGKTLSTPDAIHIATAILYRAKEFHTFDKSNKHNSLGLLPLNGSVAEHPLIITKPSAHQQSLDL